MNGSGMPGPSRPLRAAVGVGAEGRVVECAEPHADHEARALGLNALDDLAGENRVRFSKIAAVFPLAREALRNSWPR